MNNIHNEQKARKLLDDHIKTTKALRFVVWIAAILAAAALTAINAQAATVEIASGVYTQHIEEYNTARNEDNDLLALTYRFDDSDWGVLATTFNNSYDIETYGLALTYSVFKWRAIELEVIGGLMKGYTEWELHDKLCPFGEDSDYCFLIAPKLSLEVFTYKGVTPKVSVLLMGEAVMVTVGVSYKF
jgi:hypothetical protein